MLLSIVASYAPPLRVRFSSDLVKRGTNGRGAVLARRGRGAKRRGGYGVMILDIASCRCQTSAVRTSQSAHAGKDSAERG